MQTNSITKLSDAESFEIYAHGYPNYNGLTQAEKRAFLVPFVEMVRRFYDNPENLKQFEQWQTDRAKSTA